MTWSPERPIRSRIVLMQAPSQKSVTAVEPARWRYAKFTSTWAGVATRRRRSGLAAAEELARARDREADGGEPDDDCSDAERDAGDCGVGRAVEHEQVTREAMRIAADCDPAAEHRERAEDQHAGQVLQHA